MKKLLSGITLGIVLCGLYATAQQPHVTTTLPSATVKLNGASGGSGTGFTWDAALDAWVFAPPSDTDATDIVTDNFSVLDSSENVLLGVASKIIAHIPLQVAGDTYFQLEEQELDASGAVVGSLVTCETTAGAVVATMTAGGAGDVGRFAIIRRSGANTCTVGVGAGQTLDGVTDGTTTVADGAWKTFVQTGAAAWATESAYPVTGTLSGLTATAIPYASSATALADSPLFRESADITSQRNGTTAQEHQIYATYSSAGANYERLFFRAVSTSIWRLGSERAGTGASRQLRFAIDGSDYAILQTTGLSVTGTITPTGNYSANATDASSLGTSSVLLTHLYNARGQQGSKSKALVDATATNVWQVAVANNSYEGFTLDYTIFATDGTDRQVIAGSTRVAVLNNGGTETCVFGTASEAVNTSTGTLTVAFDCTAGTDTVMVRANADTSLASTTTFTIESRPNLTSGTATVTPQ